MENLTPDQRDDLLLGYEETEGAEREALDAWLARDPAARSRLERLREIEALAREGLPVDPSAWDADDTGEIDQVARADSLRRILSILVPRPRPRQPAWRRHARWALPLAAVLALVFLWPFGEEASFTDLRVVKLEVDGQGLRGAPAPAAGGVLRTGQAFALEFQLDEPAWVVIYHVDPSGRIARVFPVDLDDPAARRPAGRQMIPSPDDENSWVLGSGTGTETFLVGTAEARPEALAELRVLPAGPDRAAVVDDLYRQLASLMAQVRLIEFQHVD